MGRATNGLGWVVELYAQETGWMAATKIFPSREEAEAELTYWHAEKEPARVYEALDLKPQ